MRALAAFLFLLPTAPAIAGGPDLSHLGPPAFFDLTVHGTAYEARVPPEFWFDEFLSYEPEILILPEEIVAALCTEIVGFAEKVACNVDLGDSGKIIVIDSLFPKDLKEVIHHELAHLHGWPGDHP